MTTKATHRFYPVFKGLTAGTVICVIKVKEEDYRSAIFGANVDTVDTCWRMPDDSQASYLARLVEDLDLPIDHPIYLGRGKQDSESV